MIAAAGCLCAVLQSGSPDRVVVLEVSPAPEPAPAFDVHLLPERDATSGNAALGWLRALAAAPGPDDQALTLDWLALDPETLDDPDARPPGLALDHPATGAECSPLMREAAARPDCDWQVELDVGALLPELGRLPALARTVVLRARLQRIDGDLDGAIETLGVGLALAHDLGRGGTVIHGLVGVACANLVLDELEQVIAAPDSPNLYWALAALPSPLVDLRAALWRERELLESSVRELAILRRQPADTLDRAALEAPTRDLLLRMAEFAATGDDAAALRTRTHLAATAAAAFPAAVERLVDAGFDRASVERAPVMWVYLRDAFDRHVARRDDRHKWLLLPYPEARRALQARGPSRRPGARASVVEQAFLAFTPDLLSIRSAEASVQRRVAALQCIEAVRATAAVAGTWPRDRDEVLLPLPPDPMRGTAFTFQVTGANDAVTIEINGPALAGTTGRPGAPDVGLVYRIRPRLPIDRSSRGSRGSTEH